MFIFSSNRLTVCGSEGIYNLVKQYTAIFDIKQNNVKAKGNATVFFGVNKTSKCMPGICARFPFKQAFMYLFIHFHCSSINFKLKCQSEKLYEGHFRNRVNESTIHRITAD